MDKKSVLVVGDVMIDRYIHVRTERNAPEASIPVWDELRKENRLGGAANVAHNLKSLGKDDLIVYLAGIVGHEDRKMISRTGIDTILCTGAETMLKQRYVDEGGKFLFRSDNKKSFSMDSKQSFKSCLSHFLPGHSFDAVVFSDYDKGTIDEEIVSMLSHRGKFVVVDSKRIDLSLYRGSSFLKLNESEYSAQISRGPYDCVEELFDGVVVTLGSRGAELRQHDKKRSSQSKYAIDVEHFPTQAADVVDVTGCGDTHVAAFTFSLLNGHDPRSSVRFANVCASKVVNLFGTSVPD